MKRSTFMAILTVILFGGGDGGGLRITDHGIERIPPFDPGILRQFKAVNALIRVRSAELGHQVEKLATQMTDQLVANVQKTTGASGGAIVFMDVEDGFVCGTGPHPLPFPHHLLASLLQGGKLQGGQLQEHQVEIPIPVLK
jgi:hypothetical protein